MDKPKFEIGGNVFAKMKGFPPWPAIIESIHDLTPKKIKYSVYFYGTRQVAVVKEENLFSYSEHKNTLGKPRKSSSFNLSMAEAEANIFNVNIEGSTQHLLATLLQEAEGSPHSENSHGSIESLPQTDSPSRGEDVIDKVTASLQKEHKLISLILTIQASLGVDKADFNKALESLNEIDTLGIGHHKLMLLKNPDIVITLIRLTHYAPKFKRLSTSMKGKVQQIKEKAHLLLSAIAPLFPPQNNQSFVQAYDEELIRFKSVTKNMSKQDLIALTEDFLIACSSSKIQAAAAVKVPE